MRRHSRLNFLVAPVAALAVLAFAASCVDGISNENALTDKVVKLIPYTVTAQGPVESKASLKGAKKMIFVEGDRLFITSEDETVEGVLTLKTGGGSNEGSFEGTLQYDGPGDAPSGDLKLFARLVGVDDQIGTGTFVGGITGEMYEAVEQYSTLTGESTYSTKSFALSQGTSFITFNLSFEPAPANGQLMAVATNQEGAELLASGLVPVENGQSAFVLAIPGNTQLVKAKVAVGGLDVKFGGAATTLAAGSFYEVSRQIVDDLSTPLTLQAGKENITVSINNPLNRDIYYSLTGKKEDVVLYQGPFDLAAGKTVAFYGDGTTTAYAYFDFDEGIPYLTSILGSGACYVYGNVMSLLHPDDFPTNWTLEADFALGGLFAGNDNVDMHPDRDLKLPATMLTMGAYAMMFAGCENLTRAPELPAMEIPIVGYALMFSECIGLAEAPELPATTVGMSCYTSMFTGCTRLRECPELPATTMQESCYSEMFSYCTALRQAPELPARVLAFACYESMFEGCTRLTAAPELPATELEPACYYSMFKGCTSLTAAPVLPAEDLPADCYGNMFNGCSELCYIKCLAKNIPEGMGCTNRWVEGVATSGTFEKAEGMYGWIVDWNSGIPEGWTPDIERPLTIKPYSLGGTVIIDIPQEMPLDIDLSYRFKNDKYGYSYVQPLGRGSYTIDLSPDESLQLFGNNISLGKKSGDNYYYVHIDCTQECSITGNIMSLLVPTDFASAKALQEPYTFYSLFKDNMHIANTSSSNKLILPATELTAFCYAEMFKGSNVSEAPALPAETLASSCYESMFSNCLWVLSAPELPATTLAERCYARMFYDCIFLTQAPTLPASSMSPYCYEEMFRNCTDLKTPPDLPAINLAEGCYKGMFQNCRWLETAPSLPATTLVKSCYEDMFHDCMYGLTAAPELPATTMAERCYYGMFMFCNFSSAPILPAMVLAEDCYNQMFRGCVFMTTPPDLPASILKKNCYAQMFYNSGLTTAPVLSATKLEDGCYAGMFGECPELNYIKCLATDISAANSTADWTYNVSASGTFIRAAGIDWPSGFSGIPTGWTVQNAE